MTNDEILHIAKLARLQVEPEELPEYADKLGAILEYIAKLQELDTEGVPELAHGAGLLNVFRADVIEACDEDERCRIIDAFPHSEGDLLEVPAVFNDRTE
jgi:aspartyl-tRNA(Asn)/glutamyl-tRNA(Gln) amidotransferase subunit C